MAARDDFEEMCAAVKELVNIEIRTKPQKMDVSSMEATTAIEYSHSDWVEYWNACENQEAEDPGAGIDTASNAGSLDAFSKGKGKGKGGKRGKGKGKVKGTDGKGGGGGKAVGKGTWVERRTRHHCNDVGHIVCDCTKPRRARTISLAEDAANLNMPQANGTTVSSVAARPPVGQ